MRCRQADEIFFFSFKDLGEKKTGDERKCSIRGQINPQTFKPTHPHPHTPTHTVSFCLMFAERHRCDVTVSLWANQSQVNQHLPAALTNTAPPLAASVCALRREPTGADASLNRLVLVNPSEATFGWVGSRGCTGSLCCHFQSASSKCHTMDHYVPRKRKTHLEISQTDCFCLMVLWPPVKVWVFITIVPLNRGCLKSELLQISGALLNSFLMLIGLSHTLKIINAPFDYFLFSVSSVTFKGPVLVSG